MEKGFPKVIKSVEGNCVICDNSSNGIFELNAKIWSEQTLGLKIKADKIRCSDYGSFIMKCLDSDPENPIYFLGQTPIPYKEYFDCLKIYLEQDLETLYDESTDDLSETYSSNSLSTWYTTSSSRSSFCILPIYAELHKTMKLMKTLMQKSIQDPGNPVTNKKFEITFLQSYMSPEKNDEREIFSNIFKLNKERFIDISSKHPDQCFYIESGGSIGGCDEGIDCDLCQKEVIAHCGFIQSAATSKIYPLTGATLSNNIGLISCNKSLNQGTHRYFIFEIQGDNVGHDIAFYKT